MYCSIAICCAFTKNRLSHQEGLRDYTQVTCINITQHKRLQHCFSVKWAAVSRSYTDCHVILSIVEASRPLSSHPPLSDALRHGGRLISLCKVPSDSEKKKKSTQKIFCTIDTWSLQEFQTNWKTMLHKDFQVRQGRDELKGSFLMVALVSLMGFLPLLDTRKCTGVAGLERQGVNDLIENLMRQSAKSDAASHRTKV